MHAVTQIGRGGRPSLAEVTLRGLRVLPVVAAAEIIATLGIGLGFLALVVPGVILLVRWAVVAQAAALESENWVEALKRSAALTRGNYLHVLGLLLITGLVAIFVRDLGAAAAGKHATVVAVVVGIVVETITRSLIALCGAVLYFDLTARQEALA